VAPQRNQGVILRALQSLRNPTTPNEPKGSIRRQYSPGRRPEITFKRWEPPSSLKQNLEYSLVLDVDGSIERIEPLGQAARNYVDQNNALKVNALFPEMAKILEFSSSNPDGQVQTFLEEYANSGS